MTPSQESHLDYLEAKLILLLDTKYRAGATAHSDSLLDKTPLELIEEAIDEGIDQLVYLLTARKKLKEFKEAYGDTKIS